MVISSVAATVVSHRFLGDFPAFEVPPYTLVHPGELFAYAAMGILAGLAALAFIRSLYGCEDFFDRLQIHPALKTALGGALIGTIGIWLPHIFGVGYEAINEALNGTILWYVMMILVLVKIAAVSITIGSGGSGGIFAPSLFVGAMLGGSVGTVVHTLWPEATALPGAYALVGMGAVVAAGTHAPITAIVIIFELTNEYQIILPLMISCIIATLLATRLQRSSIYTLKLLRRGIDIYKGRAVNVLEPVSVREVIRRDVVTVAAEDRLGSVVAKLIDHPGTTLFVTDEDNRLEGVVTADQIRPVMTDASTLDALLIAQDVMEVSEFPSVAPTDSLADVMRQLGMYRGEVPVLEGGRLIGVIWPKDVIERYNTEIFKRDMARSMVSAVSTNGRLEAVPAAADALVAEVPVPSRFVGKTIRELNIRQSFGVSILMVKQLSQDGVERLNAAPASDYAFREGDVLLAMGPDDALRRLRIGVPQTRGR
jgi:CIC family chloride channel protein